MKRFLILCAALGLARAAYAVEPSVIADLAQKVDQFGGNVEDHYKGFKVLIGAENANHTINYFGFDPLGAGHSQSEEYKLAKDERFRIEQWIFSFGPDGKATFCDHSVFYKGYGRSNYGQLFGDGVINTDRRCTPKVLAKYESLFEFWSDYKPANPPAPLPAPEPDQDGPPIQHL